MLRAVLVFLLSFTVLYSTAHRSHDVEIIIYHGVTDETINERSGIAIDRAELEQHFSEIATKYKSVDTSEALSYRRGESIAKEKIPVLVTFDDGFDSVYKYAYPLAKQYRVKMLVAVLSGDKALHAGQKKLSWEQMREMQSSGLVEFASHCVEHLDLTTLSEDEIEHQLKLSKATISRELGTCDYLVVPYGCSNETVRKIAEKVGYKALFETGKKSCAKSEYPFAIKRRNIWSRSGPDPLNPEPS